MKRIVGLLFLLVVLILGLFFGLLNADPVPLNYYLGTRELPLSLLLVLAVLVGAVCGALASLGIVLRMRHENSRLRKQIRLSEKEVANLRAIPLKDTR